MAASAYRSATEIKDHRTGKTYDYSRKASGVVAAFIRLPETADHKFNDRAVLWNAAEQSENRRNANTAREMTIALPHELEDHQRQRLIKRFADWLVSRYKVAADVAIHKPDRQGDQRNHHAHVMFTTRKIEGDRFGNKTRRLDVWPSGRNEINRMRGVWQDMANDALEAKGLEQRIDHRSHKERGIEIPPQIHEGVHATAMRRRGKSISVSKVEYKHIDHGRTRHEYNAEIIKLQTYTTPTLKVQVEQLEQRIGGLLKYVDGLEINLSAIGQTPEDIIALVKRRVREKLEQVFFKKRYEEYLLQERREKAQLEEKIALYKQQLDYLQSQYAQVKYDYTEQQKKHVLFERVQKLEFPPPDTPIIINTSPAQIAVIAAHRNYTSMMNDNELQQAIKTVEKPRTVDEGVIALSKGANNVREALRRSGKLKTVQPGQKRDLSATEGVKLESGLDIAKEVNIRPRRKRRRRKRH